MRDARLGGTSLDDAAGPADVILASVFWLVKDAAERRYLGVTPYIWLPVGRYTEGKSLNVGENRWKGSAQVGLDQGFGDNWAITTVADVTWYGENSDAGAGGQTLKQNPSYQLQAWLRYDTTPQSSLAAGISQTLGGKQRLEGIETGLATETTQVRFAYSQFLTATFQIQGMVTTDLRTRGGFDEDYGAQIRLLKVF